LKKLYEESEVLFLWDFDGYDYLKWDLSFEDVINDPKRKMGHAFVIAMLLQGDRTWERETKQAPRQPSNPDLIRITTGNDANTVSFYLKNSTNWNQELVEKFVSKVQALEWHWSNDEHSAFVVKFEHVIIANKWLAKVKLTLAEFSSLAK